VAIDRDFLRIAKDVLGSVTFAVVFSGSLFVPAFAARCSGGVHRYSSTVLHSPLIISHIIGLCVHVACRVEWRPVSLFRGTGSHARVWGARQRPVFGHLGVGSCLDAPPSHPEVLVFSPRILIVSLCMLHWWVGVL
jgi:hypothetical protein